MVNIEYKDELLSVSIKDEGIGIAKEKQKHIFDAFSQEDSSITRKYGGTGLGLSISNELIKLMGGKLKLKSEVGLGSEFYFTVPADCLDEDSALDMIVQESESKDTDFENKHILLVEDNKSNQMFMEIILDTLNLTCDIANNGEEAIHMFENNKYDIILMDENMPVMNGIEATKLILEFESKQKLSHTPIIALTANALKGAKEIFLKAGMDEYLSKPLDAKKLRTLLGTYLKKV